MEKTDLLDLYFKIEPYLSVILAIVIAFISINLIYKSVRKLLGRTFLPKDVQHFVGRALVYFLWFCVLIYVTNELNLAEVLMPVIGASFLVGAAVALAIKDILSDALAGIYLLTDRHFDIGDEIETLGYTGEIVSVTLRKTRIRTAENTLVVLPNGKIDSGGWVLHEKKNKPVKKNNTEQNSQN